MSQETSQEFLQESQPFLPSHYNQGNDNLEDEALSLPPKTWIKLQNGKIFSKFLLFSVKH